jgi:hypothetical protein
MKITQSGFNPPPTTTRNKTMKIKIVQTVEIDPEAWAKEFGIDQSAVREDVQSYFRGWCQQQVEILGLEKTSSQKQP